MAGKRAEVRVPRIVDKIMKALKREKARKVIDFETLDQARQIAAEQAMKLPSPETLQKTHPAFGIYLFTQNHLVGLLELTSEMRELNQFLDLIEEAQDEYMPSGPPMSPITKSQFFAWFCCDLALGANRENLAEILGTVGLWAGFHPSYGPLFKNFAASRLGLYRHEGVHDGCVKLREVGTGAFFECIVSSGDLGKEGHLWLTRILPPPAGWQKHVVFGTPYQLLLTGEDEWTAFLKRNYPATRRKSDQEAHYFLMKYGLSRNYWLEYLFQAYVNHTPNIIYIRGLPDIEESRPHSSINSFGSF
ncbi:MAG: hypothetical protein QNK37_15965 [Acidobacteriota bacterium]|nr:hypothetical protein [Acidobacteriota bacterium]